jgi:hypothetical protein
MSIWRIKGLFIENSNSHLHLGGVKKLDFYLQIYFSTYPISPLRTNNSRSLAHEVSLFKHYLETIAAHDPMIA